MAPPRRSQKPGREPPDERSHALIHTEASERASTDSRARAVVAARAADDKQGTDIVGLEVGDVLAIADWFVIASAGNPRQVRTIAEEVERAIKAAGGDGPIRTEGLDDARWVLLDFGDVVVHVFLEEVRSFYELERLWGDVPRLDWEEPSQLPGAAHGGD